MRIYVTKSLIAFVALAATGFDAAVTRAEDRYYMIVFAYQGTPNLPRLSHSFATFVKIPDNDGIPRKTRLEAHTISWVTAPENFGLLRPPAAGHNLSLAESLQWAVEKNAAITAFGPYQIKKELYDRAMTQLDLLNSGRVQYKATDRRFRPNVAVNCFHAISDMIEGPLLDTGTAFGEPASAMVRDHLSPWIIDRQRTHRSLIPALGLDKYTINYRD